jgi:hypothetical protein
MPTCWMDVIESRAKRCSRVEDELEELKNWVQDASNRVDRFIEECGDEEQDPMWFIRRLQKDLEKKTNEVMGYK